PFLMLPACDPRKGPSGRNFRLLSRVSKHHWAKPTPLEWQWTQPDTDSSLALSVEGNGRRLTENEPVILQRCYRFRLEPTPEQEQAFRRFAGCRRWIWNWALARKQEAYQAKAESLDYHPLRAALVGLKQAPETEFLRDCHSQVLQETLRDLERAFV